MVGEAGWENSDVEPSQIGDQLSEPSSDFGCWTCSLQFNGRAFSESLIEPSLLVDATPALRNDLAHVSNMLHPNGIHPELPFLAQFVRIHDRARSTECAKLSVHLQ